MRAGKRAVDVLVRSITRSVTCMRAQPNATLMPALSTDRDRPIDASAARSGAASCAVRNGRSLGGRAVTALAKAFMRFETFRALNDRREDPTASVGVGVAALWAAWSLSAAALFINQVVLDGSLNRSGPLLGMLSLFRAGRRLRLRWPRPPTPRSVAVAVMLIAALPLEMVARLIAERAIVAAIYKVSDSH